MALIESRTPRNPAIRDQLSAADKHATLLAGLGWILTLGAILGLPGPDAWFMGLATAVATVAVFPALLGIFMQQYRAGWARLFLVAGAAALALIGAGYVTSASTARVIVAYFLPGALLLTAAGVLSAARARPT
jgi:hypothetical protein